MIERIDKMLKTLKKYILVILFAGTVGFQIGILVSEKAYSFAAIFAIYNICSFTNGWATHSIWHNSLVLEFIDLVNKKHFNDSLLQSYIEEAKRREDDQV